MLPVSKEFADYIEELKENISKSVKKECPELVNKDGQITTRLTTKLLCDILPRNVNIIELTVNNNKHLKKQRDIQIVLKYQIGDM